MADLVYMHKDKWTDHLDAIRAKAGTSDTMTVDEATTAVEGISGGTDTSDATLNSGGQMLNGVTAYSQGTKYTGTIPTQAAATITPTESAQTAVSAGKYTAGDVTVGAIPSDYIGTDIPRRSSISVSQDNNTIHVEDGYYGDDIDTSMGACTVTGASVLIDNQGDATGSIIVGRGGYINSGSHAFYVEDVVTPRSSSDLTASGATVSVPYGYYSADASKTVASGSAGTPTATKGSVSNHAVNVTPSVTNTEGYISGGTLTGTAVSVSASELVSGNKAITENGTGIDVANYSTVSVDVQGGSTVSVVDTTDSGGGTVRTITASGTTIPTPASDISKLILNGVTQMDVTDTTATVSDVASGKVFTQVDGTTGTGTASGGQNIIEMHNVYGSATKWNSPEFENTFSGGGYLEVDVDLSQQAAGTYSNIISVGSRTVISTWANTAVSHVYFNSDTNEISVSQNRVATTFTILDTSVPHTIKVDKDYFYVDGNSVVALQSGVLAQQRLMIGSSEGNVRFTGEYKSIILK